jgi:hypothetical protein
VAVKKEDNEADEPPAIATVDAKVESEVDAVKEQEGDVEAV